MLIIYLENVGLKIASNLIWEEQSTNSEKNKKKSTHISNISCKKH